MKTVARLNCYCIAIAVVAVQCNSPNPTVHTAWSILTAEALRTSESDFQQHKSDGLTKTFFGSRDHYNAQSLGQQPTQNVL